MDYNLEPKYTNGVSLKVGLGALLLVLLLALSLYFAFSEDELHCYLPEGCPATEPSKPSEDPLVPVIPDPTVIVISPYEDENGDNGNGDKDDKDHDNGEKGDDNGKDD